MKEHIQKCIIEFSDGSKATFVGSPQVDTTKPIKIKKFSFTVPREVEKSRTPNLDFFEKMFNGGYK